MAIRAVLCDFDETLADTLPGRTESLRHALSSRLGREIPTEEILATIRGASNLEDQVTTWVADAGAASVLVQTYREHYYRPDRGPLTLYPGIAELLSQLRGAGTVLGVVTSRYRSGPDGNSHWGVLRELELLGLSETFAAVVGYEDSERHKPEPEPFLMALDRLALRPEEVLGVGDSQFDVLGARRAGMRTAAALWGAYDRVTLIASKPDILLEQPAELLGFL